MPSKCSKGHWYEPDAARPGSGCPVCASQTDEASVISDDDVLAIMSSTQTGGGVTATKEDAAKGSSGSAILRRKKICPACAHEASYSFVYCPRCGSTNVYELKTRPWHWECPDCRQGGAYRFSDITGTVFENTNKPLRDWFRVLHLILTSKKGISARQIHRFMGFGSLKTAWYMAHRLRGAMADKEFQKLMGVVEVDETYIGGKSHNRGIR